MAYTRHNTDPGIDPGPQLPGDGKVGENYRHWGNLEDRGWIYDSSTDTYSRSADSQKEQLKKLGLYKKPPSLLEQIAPLAAATGGVTLAKTLASDPGSVLSGIKGLFGLGSGASSAASSIPGLDLASDLGTNLFGLGSSGAAAEAVPEAAGPLTGLASLGVPLAVAAGTYLGGKSILDSLQGKQDDSSLGKAGRLTADIATGGLAELPGLFGLGHSQNYNDAQARHDAFNTITGGKDLSLPTASGGTYNLTGNQIEDDPTAYNSGKDVTADNIAKANSIFGLNGTPDTLHQQLASTFSNALQAGVDPTALTQLASQLNSPTLNATAGNSGPASATRPDASQLLKSLDQSDPNKLNPLNLIYQNQSGIG